MDSDSDDGQSMASFTTDGDFVNGQWIDGEFYYESERRGRNLTKDEAIYGYDENLDREYQKSAGASSNRSVNFISSGIVDQKKNDADRSDENSPSTLSSGISLDNQSVGIMQSSNRGMTQLRRHLEEKKGHKPVDVDKNFGDFEKHTKGIGLKLLKKMGFSGRLGKNEQGIVKPVEVKVRPKNLGLSASGFKEKVSSAAYRNKEEEEKMKGRNDSESNVEVHSRQIWKRNKVKEKIVYKTAEDLTRTYSSGNSEENAPLLIEDMTGPMTRLTNSSKIIQRVTAAPVMLTSTGAKMIMPELQHNLQMMIDMAELDIINTDRDMIKQKNKMAKMEKEREYLEKKTSQENEILQRLEEVLQIIDRTQSSLKTIGADIEPLNVESIADLFDMIMHKYSREYNKFGLSNLVVAIAFPQIKKFLDDWKPLSNPNDPIHLLTRWKMILGGGSTSDKDTAFSSKKKYNNIYIQFQEAVLLPRVRTAIVNDWDPREPEPCLLLLEKIKSLMSEKLFQQTLETTVLPKLKNEVDQWSPRDDLVPVHLWLHPWLPLISDHLEPIHTVVRQKISRSLTNWHADDASAYAMISPWQNIWTEHQMQYILVKFIVPKLHSVLKNLVINPRSQNIEPFSCLMLWVPLITQSHIVNILETEFFPKWYDCLYNWLSTPSPSYEQISQWYKGWKNVFPEELRSNSKVESLFSVGLDLINAKLNNTSMDSIINETKKKKKIADQFRSINSNFERKQEKINPEPKRVEPDEENDDISFKEIVERFAGLHGIPFVPNFERGQIDGKQIFHFGKTNIYLDNRCIYSFQPSLNGEKRWKAIALDDLLKMNEDDIETEVNDEMKLDDLLNKEDKSSRKPIEKPMNIGGFSRPTDSNTMNLSSKDRNKDRDSMKDRNKDRERESRKRSSGDSGFSNSHHSSSKHRSRK